MEMMDAEEQDLTAQICGKAIKAYGLFRNKDGLDTYNFWRTRPSGHFPYGRIMHRFDHFRIPDDIDDTALIYLTEDSPKERVARLREKLKAHANLAYRKARNTFPEYRDMRVYSTFIGKNMYIEFDVCVLSNLMRLVLLHFKDELNSYDRDSLHFIGDVVRRGRHLSDPYRSAPQYTTVPIILYHLARLAPLLPDEYSDVSEIVLRDVTSVYRDLPAGMSKLMLENTMMEMGQMVDPQWMTPEMCNDPEFFYFVAGLLTAYEGEWVQKLAEHPLTHLRFRSEAFNRTLLVRNTLLRRAV